MALDGNFKANHMMPKNEWDDVHLTAGEGFMTAQGPYQEHLKDATERAPRYKKVSFMVQMHTYRGQDTDLWRPTLLYLRTPWVLAGTEMGTDVDTEICTRADTEMHTHSDTEIGAHADTEMGAHAEAEMHTHSDTEIGTHADTKMGAHAEAEMGAHADTEMVHMRRPRPCVWAPS